MLLERQSDKINRQVQFLHAQAYDTEDTTGKNNTWLYDRAPDGYKFILDSIDISTCRIGDLNQGSVAVYDGHEYTHWLQFPGVESKELLFRTEINNYLLATSGSLRNWECKEYTIGIRSHSVTLPFKTVTIVWYYLRKMNWLEKLQYAVMQPRGQRYRKGGPTTVERDEELGT